MSGVGRATNGSAGEAAKHLAEGALRPDVKLHSFADFQDLVARSTARVLISCSGKICIKSNVENPNRAKPLNNCDCLEPGTLFLTRV